MTRDTIVDSLYLLLYQVMAQRQEIEDEMSKETSKEMKKDVLFRRDSNEFILIKRHSPPFSLLIKQSHLLILFVSPFLILMPKNCLPKQNLLFHYSFQF